MSRRIIAEARVFNLDLWGLVQWAAQRALLFNWNEVTVRSIGRSITACDQ